MNLELSLTSFLGNMICVSLLNPIEPVYISHICFLHNSTVLFNSPKISLILIKYMDLYLLVLLLRSHLSPFVHVFFSRSNHLALVFAVLHILYLYILLKQSLVRPKFIVLTNTPTVLYLSPQCQTNHHPSFSTSFLAYMYILYLNLTFSLINVMHIF
jgi:hypothetical protein